MATEQQLDKVAAFLDGWEIPWNEDQLKLIASVYDVDEHAVGQAVPGSGKTTCIVSMVHYLLNSHLKVARDQVLVCSFNTSCAELIRQRLARVAGMSERQYTMLSRTYHSVGFEICKKMGRGELVPSGHEILMDTIRLHTQEFEELPYDMKTVAQIITYTKNRGGYVLSPGRLDSSVYIPQDVITGLGVEEKIISSVLRCYEKIKGNMIDFDDQIALPYQKWAQGEENPFKAYHKLRYLLVDELQDANRAQMGMIKAIQEVSGCKVIGVGDSDQAIYSWRGAVAHNMEHFQKEFKAQFFPIPHNYRSGFRILETASSVIKKNPGHDNYALKAGRKKARGEVIEVTSTNSAAEMDAVWEIIKSLNTCGDFEGGPFRYNQITIIARTNQVLGHAARYLFSKGIPIIARMDDMKGEFNQVLNCVAAVLNHPNADMRDVLQSIRQVGEKRAKQMTAYGVDLDDVEVAAIGKGKIAEKVKGLVLSLRHIRMKGDKVDEIYGDLAAFRNLVYKVVALLERFTYEYTDHVGITMRQDLRDAAHFIYEMAERQGARASINMMYDMGDVDLTADRNDAIELMTAHRAKGQENKAIIILDGDNFPLVHMESDDESYHQEINLLFVAMTRAKDMLVVSRYPKMMNVEGNMTTITSDLYDDIIWDAQVKWDMGEENKRAFKECFPIKEKTKPKPKQLRSWEIAKWPLAIKSFQTGKDLEEFKGQVAGKFEQEGYKIYLHQPSSKPHYEPETLEERLQVLKDTSKDMMNSRAKGKDENQRNEDKQEWLSAAGKVLSDHLGEGWRPDIYSNRTWLRYLNIQRDEIFSIVPPPNDGRTSETFLVASLVLSIAGHPKLQATVSLKVSHAKFVFCRNADTVDSLLRYEIKPVASPIGMLLWKSEDQWSKSIKPDQGFQAAIPYVLERMQEIRVHEEAFMRFINEVPDWFLETKCLPFHPGGHLWVHREPDTLWPIHPKDILLVDHMGGRENYSFDLAAQQREQSFFDSFRLGEKIRTIQEIQEHIEETWANYRALPIPAWEYVVARAFNVPTAGVMSDSVGKRIQFNVTPCPEMTYPEAGFDDSLSQFLKKPVSFKVI